LPAESGLRRKRIKTWKAAEAEVILLDDSAAVAGEPDFQPQKTFSQTDIGDPAPGSQRRGKSQQRLKARETVDEDGDKPMGHTDMVIGQSNVMSAFKPET
jgi:hypothetical protein